MPVSEDVKRGLAQGASSGVLGLIGDTIEYERTKNLTANARAYDTERWKRENAYNSPSAQVQRLMDAGLNPNLMYGESASTGNTDGVAPSAIPDAPNTGLTFNNAASTSVNAMLAQSQAQKNYADASLSHAKTDLTKSETDFNLQSMDVRLKQLFQQSDIQEEEKNKIRETVSFIQQQTATLRAQEYLFGFQGDLIKQQTESEKENTKLLHNKRMMSDYDVETYKSFRDAEIDRILNESGLMQSQKSLIGSQAHLLNSTMYYQQAIIKARAAEVWSQAKLNTAQMGYFNALRDFQRAQINYLPFMYVDAISQSYKAFEHDENGKIKTDSKGVPIPSKHYANTNRVFETTSKVFGIIQQGASAFRDFSIGLGVLRSGGIGSKFDLGETPSSPSGEFRPYHSEEFYKTYDEWFKAPAGSKEKEKLYKKLVYMD